ncbi:MAG: NADH-quinone oxidoreductase subunit N, partial [Akkermansiaceae bacterium]|nr:NADH-quinone oxidoreductase subunit N [Akkermansiaceae bacterium]
MAPYYLEAYVVVLGLVLLMLEAFGPAKRKQYLGLAAIGGLVFALILLVFTEREIPGTNAEMTRFYVIDSQALFYKFLALICTILVLLLTLDFRRILSEFTENPGSEDGTGEYYALPVFACAGMMWMASAKDLVSLFVALELVTITFYILVAYMRRNVGSLEAGVKYLILGALSTGFLVYGIAWVYGTLGTTDLAVISTMLADPGAAALADRRIPLLFGLALILLALAFKIGAVPMQLWIPDVYQGAPTPTTAFLSVGSKAAGFIAALRILEPFLQSEFARAQTVFILLVLAALTILYGNLAAIPQSNFKRLLAYSSIAHAGFILLAITAWHGDPEGPTLTSGEVVGFYLGTYLLMTMGAFFVLVVVRNATGSEEISAFDGLACRNPALALTTAILLAALAGLPLTAGFYGKLFAFQLAIDSKLWWGVALRFIGVAAG